MNKQSIETRLFDLLRCFLVKKEDEAIQYTQLTGTPLFLDSIQLFEFLMATENEFGIAFTSEDIYSGAFESIDRLSDIILEKVK